MLIRRNEGSALTVFLVVTGACIALLWFGVLFAGVFLTKVRAANAADAAAEAALLALKEPIRQGLEDQSTRNLARFWNDVSVEVSRRLSEWEDSYRLRRQAELEDQVPPLTDGEIEAIIRQEIADRYPSVARNYKRHAVRSRQPDIADLLLSGTPLPGDLKYRHFLESREIGCIVRHAGDLYHDRMVDWAQEYSVANRGEAPGDRDVALSTPGTLKVHVYVPYRMYWFALDPYVDERYHYLLGESVQQITHVAGIPLAIPERC